MPQKNEKMKRIRRTNHELEQNITAAMTKLVAERGFTNLSLLAVAQQAKVEPQVIYNKYGNFTGLLETFAKRYEYWLNDVIDKILDTFHEGKYEEFITKILQGIARKLYKDRVMQQLLIWEISEKNFITEHSAVFREANTYMVSAFYQKHLEHTGIDFNTLTAIITAGTYYLILHKNASTFCTVDFNTKEGENLLVKTIGDIYALVFDKLQPNKQMMAAAKKMKTDGMDNKLIAKYTGLPLKTIKGI